MVICVFSDHLYKKYFSSCDNMMRVYLDAMLSACLNVFFICVLFFFVTDKIMATLGEGTFGKVVKVRDMVR